MIDTPTNEPRPEDNRYPVYPPDDGTDRPRNPYGDHWASELESTAAAVRFAQEGHGKASHEFD